MPNHHQRVRREGYTRQADSETLCGFHELLAAFLPTTGSRIIAIEAVSAVVWFLAVMWLNFTGAAEVNMALAVATGVFVGLLTLLLAVSSAVIKSLVVIDGSLWRRRSQPSLLSWDQQLNDCATMRSASWAGRRADRGKRSMIGIRAMFQGIGAQHQG